MFVSLGDACFISPATGRICRLEFAYMACHWRKLACLALSWAILGPTCGHPEPNYGHQGLHFEIRSAKIHRKNWIGLHIRSKKSSATLLVAILSQITAIKGLISSQDQQKYIGINGSVCRCFTHACFHGRSMRWWWYMMSWWWYMMLYEGQDGPQDFSSWPLLGPSWRPAEKSWGP